MSITTPKDYVQLLDLLVEEGYDWKIVDETVEVVGERHGVFDEHGYAIRPFGVTMILEIRDLLDRPRPTGRPPVGPRVAVRLPQPLLSDLDEVAAMTGTSRSDLVRRYVRAGMDADWEQWKKPAAAAA